MRTFSEAKREFDSKYFNKAEFESFVPIHTTKGKTCKIRSKDNLCKEEYYKCQFLYALVYSGLFEKDYIGAEVHFPKGNKNAAPIRFDAAIFDDVKWFDWYKLYHGNKNQDALDWLRKHLICVVEFKKENSKDVESIYNIQLKPAMKESESNFCLGIIYDAERLYLLQKKKDVFIRLDESLNAKGDKSATKDLSLHLTDAYNKIPSFFQLQRKMSQVTIDRTNRTIDDLDVITGVYSKQLTDGISNILRIMDKISMKNQRGYEILVQTIAMKIFDEKNSLRTDPRQLLSFYRTDPESEKLKLLFYIEKKEKEYASLGDEHIKTFIDRMRHLYNKASEEYTEILNAHDAETIVWENLDHIKIISEIVEKFQDYSFVLSQKTDLYQIVFYKFANEFSKTEKAQFITPIPLIDFLVQIVNPRSTEKIIDPTVGIADFLSVSYVNSKSKLSDKNIYGIDNDKQMVALAQLNMLLNGDGESILEHKPDMGSIIWKFAKQGGLVALDPSLNYGGNWDNKTNLKKFDVVLTNPPFGEDRKWQPKTQNEILQAQMYELWNTARVGDWIDLGIVFLENAYRILDENGRLGIILSNSIASIDRWEKARKWLIQKMRIVALFDLPPNVFADTGVNTTLIVAYKPDDEALQKLKETGYQVFVRNIKRVGYEIRTSKRVKYFNPIYKVNESNFEIEQDAEGKPLIDEEFSETVMEFRHWCLGQEKKLQDLFIKEK